jgi:hypothetical protein
MFKDKLIINKKRLKLIYKINKEDKINNDVKNYFMIIIINLLQNFTIFYNNK